MNTAQEIYQTHVAGHAHLHLEFEEASRKEEFNENNFVGWSLYISMLNPIKIVWSTLKAAHKLNSVFIKLKL